MACGWQAERWATEGEMKQHEWWKTALLLTHIPPQPPGSASGKQIDQTQCWQPCVFNTYSILQHCTLVLSFFLLCQASTQGSLCRISNMLQTALYFCLVGLAERPGRTGIALGSGPTDDLLVFLLGYRAREEGFLRLQASP